MQNAAKTAHTVCITRSSFIGGFCSIDGTGVQEQLEVQSAAQIMHSIRQPKASTRMLTRRHQRSSTLVRPSERMMLTTNGRAFQHGLSRYARSHSRYSHRWPDIR